MGRITHDHFCVLIFGQGLWKDSFTKKISKDTKTSFFHLSGYSKDSLFCTCPICNALVKLFDPLNPGDYVNFCDLCKALYKKFEDIKGQNEGVILFSHQLIRETDHLKNLAQKLLSNEKIKKIYILEVEWVKISKPIPLVIKNISQKRLKKSEFFEILKTNKFEYRVIYEIFKDRYY
ncbi:MAG: hypothetical protein ACFFDK_17275 [Promethearchaeota archaeon]